MQITVRCFATLREIAADRTTLALPRGATVADAWEALAVAHPGLVAHAPFVRAARNGEYAAWEVPLENGDLVAFLPPVSGGGPSGLTEDVIDVRGLESTIAATHHGALVTFVGRARNRADDGREVLELEYEAYPEMATAVLAEIVGDVERRWTGCIAAVVHRVGRVPIGEAAVAIVTAAAHRSDAYEANRFVIEAIKERLPIWKLERFADGSEWKRPGA